MLRENGLVVETVLKQSQHNWYKREMFWMLLWIWKESNYRLSSVDTIMQASAEC